MNLDQTRIDDNINDLKHRFDAFDKNFRNREEISGSLLSFLVALGLPVYFIVNYFIQFDGSVISVMEKKLAQSFWLVFIINSIIVFLFTMAVETRLFALPLFFIWPFLGKAIIKGFSFSSQEIVSLKNLEWRDVIYLTTAIVSAFIFSKLYELSGWEMNENYYQEYFFFMLLIIFVHQIIHRKAKRYEKIVQ